MSEQGGLFQNFEVRSDTFTTCETLANEIRVLLVEHDKECLISTTRFLELCSYRVTVVELASTALLLLSKGNEHFDLVMANVHSPDMHGFNLLEEANSMNLPMIFTSTNEEIALAKSALDKGAFLFLQKPITLEVLVYLWQHVHRERNRMIRERELKIMVDRDINGRPKGYNPRGRRPDDDDEDGNGNQNANQDNTQLRRVYRKRRVRTPRDTKDDEDFDLNNNNRAKRKKCIEWTKDLHSKFMSVIHILGEGRCYPKEILELMNVPGLTRVQVASHLQKCRNDKWQTPKTRKNNSLNALPSTVDRSQPRTNIPRRFGSMPLSLDDDNQHGLPKKQGRIRSQNFFPPPGTNFERGESSRQGFGIQLELESEYLNGNNVPNCLGKTETSREALILGTPSDGSISSRLLQTQSDIGKLTLGSGTSFVNHYEPIMSELNLSTPGANSSHVNYPPPQIDEFLELEMENYYLVEHLDDEHQEPSSRNSPIHLDLNEEKPASNEQQTSAVSRKTQKTSGIKRC